VRNNMCVNGSCWNPICGGEGCAWSRGNVLDGANIDGTQCPTNTQEPPAVGWEVPCHQVNVPDSKIDTFEVR